MRVLYLITSHSGGPGMVLDGIVNYCGVHPGAIIVLTPTVDGSLTRSSEPMVSWLWYPKGKVGFFRRYFAIFSMARSFRPDIVLSFDFRSNFLGCIFRFWLGVPWIASVHGLVAGFSGWRLAVQRAANRFASRIAVPSVAVRNRLIETHAADIDRIEVIPNGIKMDASSPELVRPVIEGFRVACVANFYSPLKGHEVAVEALSYLDREVRLTFFGEGRLMERIARRASDLRLLDRIEFRGSVDNDMLRKELRNFDVLVVPSLSESFCIAAVEGMAAGLPVVASRVGGIPEVVEDGHTGVLVPPGDARAISEAINALRTSPERLDAIRLTVAAHARARFNVTIMGNGYLALLRAEVDRGAPEEPPSVMSSPVGSLLSVGYLMWAALVVVLYFSQFDWVARRFLAAFHV